MDIVLEGENEKFRNFLDGKIKEITKIVEMLRWHDCGRLYELLKYRLFDFESEFIYCYIKMNRYHFRKKNLLDIALFSTKFLKINNFNNIDDVDIEETLRKMCEYL